MYALFKQGTQDPPFDKAEKPGMFDLKVGSSAWFLAREGGLLTIA